MNKTLFFSVAMLAAVSTAQAQVAYRTEEGVFFTPKEFVSAGTVAPQTSGSKQAEPTTSFSVYDTDFNLVKSFEVQNTASRYETYTQEAVVMFTSTENQDPVYDDTNAAWSELGSGSSTPSISYTSPKRLEYYDLDNGTQNERFRLSQTLFNDDDKWEYVIITYGGLKTEYGNSYLVNANYDTGKATIRRTVTRSTSPNAIAVYNENGEEVVSFPYSDLTSYDVFSAELDKIYNLNGKIYLMFSLRCYVPGDSNGSTFYEYVIYRYDKGTTSVAEVARSRSVAPFVTVDGDNINVTVGEDDGDANAVLVDMSGKSVAAASVSAGSTSATLNAKAVPAGIYNVAVVKGGNVTRAQKVVLK